MSHRLLSRGDRYAVNPPHAGLVAIERRPLHAVNPPYAGPVAIERRPLRGQPASCRTGCYREEIATPSTRLMPHRLLSRGDRYAVNPPHAAPVAIERRLLRGQPVTSVKGIAYSCSIPARQS